MRTDPPRGGRLWRTTGVLSLLIGLWWVVSALGLLNPFLFPSPWSVARDTWAAFGELPFGGEGLWYHLGRSALRALAGWVLGSAVGVAFGLLVEWWRSPGAIASALLEVARPVPVIVVLPLLVVAFGLGDLPRVLVIAWACFVFVAINTIYGVRAARGATYTDVVRSFGGDARKVLVKAVLGLARPYVVAGMRQAVGIAIVLMVASELILSTNGIGWFILTTRRSLYPALMYGGIALVGVLGLAAGALFGVLERRLLRGFVVGK